MSDRIPVINDGKLVQVGTPHTIYNQPANPFVADFIGESSMLPLTRDNAGKLFFENHLIADEYATDADTECSLVIRPERLFVIRDEVTDTDQTIVFSGAVREFVYQGETAFAQMSISDKYDLSFRFGTNSASSENDMRPGDQISLGLNRRDVIIIPHGGDR